MNASGILCLSGRRNRARGFTLTDLMVVVAAVSVLAAIVVARAASVKETSGLARCTANLKQVAGAVSMFCNDHDQTLPSPADTAPNSLWWWYKEDIKDYLGLTGPSSPSDLLFACPGDRGYSDPKPFHLNPRFDFGSYVFNGVTLPDMPNIAGWQLSSVKRTSQTLLVMEWTAHAPLAWHKSKTGKHNMPFYCDAESVVGFVDGHVSFSKIYYDGYNAAYTRDPIPGYEYQYSGN
jgi:prepilin-type N-terminal cleavage/methylation domain-containing protein